MIRFFLLGFTAVVCCSFFTGTALAADPMESSLAERPLFSLGIGFDYETGDYGTGNEGDFISVPFYLDIYPNDRLDVELIVPYVSQRMDQDGVTTVFYRTPNGTIGSSASRSGNGKNSTVAASSDSITTSETVSSSHRVSEHGLGDITLTVGYVVMAESESMPLVRPTFYIKFPTADEDKGFGTGEFDFGPGLTLGKWIDSWHLFAEGLYVVQGDSPLYDTKDYLSYNAGVGHQFGANVYGAVMARGMTAPAMGAGEVLEGRLKGVWRVATDIGIEAYVGTGLNDQSSDFSSSLAVFFDF